MYIWRAASCGEKKAIGIHYCLWVSLVCNKDRHGVRLTPFSGWHYWNCRQAGIEGSRPAKEWTTWWTTRGERHASLVRFCDIYSSSASSSWSCRIVNRPFCRVPVWGTSEQLINTIHCLSLWVLECLGDGRKIRKSSANLPIKSADDNKTFKEYSVLVIVISVSI